MIWMWSDHVSLLFSVTPKYLACCTSLICEFRIEYWNLTMSLLLVILKNSHLDGLKHMFHLCAQFSRISKSL